MILTIIIISIIPYFLVWINEVRLRKLSEDRLQISESVLKMEKLMLNGVICKGDASHDTLFKVMQHIQYNDKFSISKDIEPTQHYIEFRKSLTRELEQENCPFSSILRDFMYAHFRAFVHKHPFLSFIYITNQLTIILKEIALIVLKKEFKAIDSKINMSVEKIKKNLVLNCFTRVSEIA